MTIGDIFIFAGRAWRRARLVPLVAAYYLSNRLCSLIRRCMRTKNLNFTKSPGLGLSIIIPERGNIPMLSECLASAINAARHLSQPYEIIVIVDGGAAHEYADLIERHAKVQWIFNESSDGFCSAIRKGLKASQYDWVYLLNSDMLLDKEALIEVLKWRAPHIFAVGSQIFFKDTTKRREETGWAKFTFVDGLIEIYDDLPEDNVTVRGSAYAGGGSSLFQKQILQKVLGRSDPYYPFYWEDFEWGAVAWKLGYEILFCPTSKAWHLHRGTISRFYKPCEIQRVFKRNAIQFQLRNLRRLGSFRRLCIHIGHLDSISFRDIVGYSNIWRVFWARLRSARFLFDDRCLQYACDSYYLKSKTERSKPRILIVSPFSIYPPSHGGAMRIYHLLRQLSANYDLVVLCDEHENYSPESKKYLEGLAEIHFVGGRIERPGDIGSRSGRIRSHCHPAIANELKRRIAADHPDLVQIEFMELAALIEIAPKSVPWAITLHEVTLSRQNPGPNKEDKWETALLNRYDAVLACSEEDRSLLRGASEAAVIPNGMDLDGFEYSSSENRSAILFMGPFRYKPNFDGIQFFLENIYPRLRQVVPAVQLWILGGHGAVETAAPLRFFKQAGVIIYDFIPDPRPFLYQCALTINPLIGSRGSSLKLIESIAAGRVCISTSDGARGFAKAGFRSLLIRDRIEDFYNPIERLLLDPQSRISIERPDRTILQQYSWVDSGLKLSALYEKILADHKAAYTGEHR